MLLTFQYVFKIDNVSVFCKDLEPVFSILFLFLECFCSRESVETLQICTCGFSGYSRGVLAMPSALVPQVL